jgi:hypothetical protein
MKLRRLLSVTKLEAVFARLRDVLAAHASEFAVAEDSAQRYSLEAPIGPATVHAWGGKVRTQTIPVAWIDMRRAYVSYHLMGITGDSKLAASFSSALRARMELARVTAQSLLGMRKAGYVSERL